MKEVNMNKTKNTKDEERVLAKMAHDIKAPLSAIVSILGVIQKGYVNDIDKVKELVSRASQKAVTLISMVDDILDYTLLANKSMMRREKIHLFDVFMDSISTMKPYADKRNITFAYNQELCKEKYVNGNYTFLLRAINNIIMNAIKYNKENGNITINCQENTNKNTITITITDTGIGVPEEDLDKIFQVFERGKYARKNIDGSLGLGLSLVKQIVEDHYGDINLTSTVGVGTAVALTLPLLKEKTKNKEG
jgi:two-component system phosphate regulon sensor histidine kinase PhoR